MFNPNKEGSFKCPSTLKQNNVQQNRFLDERWGGEMLHHPHVHDLLMSLDDNVLTFIYYN